MTPLAEILRPKSLDEYIGQQHLVGQGAVLRTLIESGQIPSMIFWGPPGIGKTTLAMIISNTLHRPFHTLSAISSGVKEVRDVINKAQEEEGAILFIDEIHRFNKAQQDSLLGAVERGTITLIGATTENPSFEVISALLSRCQVYVLKEFDEQDMRQLIDSAVRHYASQGVTVEVREAEALMRISGGDARKLLGALELVVNRTGGTNIVIDNKKATDVVQQNLAFYDKQGEMHYDIISAFIKSIRGSDPDAAVYWLARLIEGGEDPKFIARRLCISAAEDIGLANPNALLLANATFDIIQKIGWPEGRIPLSECTIYLAASAKSNSAYMAINAAQQLVAATGNAPVPLHLRNAPTKLMKQLGYGKDYKYAHDFPGHFVNQEYMPQQLHHPQLWVPQDNPAENVMRARQQGRWHPDEQ